MGHYVQVWFFFASLVEYKKKGCFFYDKSGDGNNNELQIKYIANFSCIWNESKKIPEWILSCPVATQVRSKKKIQQKIKCIHSQLLQV